MKQIIDDAKHSWTDESWCISKLKPFDRQSVISIVHASNV